MRYQTFGRRVGLRVSEYVLGTANFGTGPTATGAEGARAIFERFVEAGGTTFDASNIYRNGEAETLLGELLGNRRDDFVVITKYTGSRSHEVRPGTTGNSRKVMIRSVEESLRRLRTDYIDVLMPHFPDGVTPMSEILSGFEDLVRAGKIRYGGLSNFPAWRTAGAAVRAELTDPALLVGIQTEYSLAERSAEREILPMAQAHGLGVVLYSPLAGGLLTGKYRRGESGRLTAEGAVDEGGQRAAVVDVVLRVADEAGLSPIHVALAWLRRRAGLAQTSLMPIVGPRTIEHLETYLGALDVDLDPEHYRLLDQVSMIRLGAPHEDVAAALSHGTDGDRSLLDVPTIPVA
ncbi:aldo/keto reductase [Promicromonospora sp. NPDC057488]|uniref:aldo/keto reductase n=1 Tax=Promicromonospora sp. NPDC057488 TaxID=3346147 RepID=UPI00366ADCCB